MRTKIEGSCHCGKISYEADINPDLVMICHCSDCQIISGAPCRASVLVKAENFQLRGQPKSYVKTGGSGKPRAEAFCAECGSALYSTSLEERPSLFNLRLGAVKQRVQLVPKFQGFCNSAMPWVMDIARIPRISDQSHS
jgi:hypothetical protein